MNNELIYWLWLSLQKGISPRQQRKLIDIFKSPSEIFHNSGNIYGLVPDKNGIAKPGEIIEYCLKRNIEILSLDDKRYPSRLKDNIDMPVLIYAIGKIKDVGITAAVVGPRKCGRTGRQLAIDTSTQLAIRGITIVSGMAAGVDAYAHTAAVRNNAYTIAVLGCGVDQCYPQVNRSLYEAIAEKGLIVSELPPGTHPSKFTFPHRNRIIAALADEVLVIEPGRKSGSLITADYARKYGKPVQILRSESH